MREQVANRDRAAVLHNPGQPLLDAVVERELALVRQLQDDRRHELFVTLPIRKRSATLIGRFAARLSYPRVTTVVRPRSRT